MFKLFVATFLLFSTLAHAESDHLRFRLDLRDDMRSFLSTDIISYSTKSKVKMSGQVEQPYTSSCTTVNKKAKAKVVPESKCTTSTFFTGYEVVLDEITVQNETISFVVYIKTQVFQSMKNFNTPDNLTLDLPEISEANYQFRFTVKNSENLIIPLKSAITSEKEQHSILNPDLKLVIKSSIIN